MDDVTGDAQEIVDRLWTKNRHRVSERIAVLAHGLAALARGEEPDPAPLVAQAHALAGVLGTYGRPGSEAMLEVEEALGEPVAPEEAARLLEAVRDVERRIGS